MTHDWLADAQTVLAGADDRVAVSEARITELLGTTIDPIPLPQQWTLDSARLPKAVADKLARREAQGLPVPLHAHSARTIAAYTPAEWEEVRRRYLTATSVHRFLEDTRPAPAAPSSADTLTGSVVTPRQLDELRAQLPHTEDTSDRKDSTLGRFVDAFYFGGRLSLLRDLLMVALIGLGGVIGIGPLDLDATTGLMLAVLAGMLGLLQVAKVRADRRADIELSGADYRDLELATVAEPGPEPGTPEHQLAQIAAALAAQITTCPAWSSDDLSVHRIQLDPDAEAAQVTAHAAEISRVRATLGPAPDGDSDVALRARAQRAGDEEILATVTASLARRVAALYRYAAELSALNTDYLALQVVERSLTASGHLETLIRQTGGDELTVRHLDRLTTDARDLHAAISTRLQILTGDLTALHALPAGPEGNRA